MSDTHGGVDSPQEGTVDRKSVHISEDPDSKAHLEALFEVVQHPTPLGKGPGGKPMHERKGIPPSFFNATSAKPRLGPSISVHPPGVSGPHHSRSMSLPASIDHGHGRQYSLDSAMGQLPQGWEMAKTPDGLTYFIDHNSRTTSWENPRKAMMAQRARPSIPHHLQQQHSMSQYHQSPPPPAPPLIQQMPQHQQQQSLDALPDGWQKAYTPEGEVYYVNHKNRTTSWLHPNMAQHQHSHSITGMPGVGHHPISYAQYSRHQQHQQQGMSLQQQLQAEKDMLRKQQYQMQRQDHMLQVMGNEAKQVPTTLYGDPYLSSSDHVRQASHDSGLGPTTMPYHSDIGVDFDEGMDTSSAGGMPMNKPPGGMRGPPNRTIEYIESMQSSDAELGIQDQQPSMETEQSLLSIGVDWV